MNAPVIEFCRARQALKDEQTRRKDTLEETADSKRITLDRLKQSMVDNALDCVSLPPEENGEPRYARLVAGPPRYATFRTVDDVVRFAPDMAQQLSNTPEVDVPAEALRIFLDRAKREETPDRRLVIVPKIPARVVPASNPPAPVKTASKTLSSAITEYKTCRLPIKALRTATRDAERVVENVVKQDAPVLLQMNKNGKRRLLNVSKETKPPPKRALGIRRVTRIVQESARYAVHDRSNFDVRFSQRIREMVTEEERALVEASQDRTSIRVRERRVASDRVVLTE